MQKTIRIFVGILIFARVLAFFRFPFGAILSIVSVLSLTILTLTGLFKAQRKNKHLVPQRLMELALSLWADYLILRLHYLPYSFPLLLICIATSIVAIILISESNKFFSPKTIILLTAIILGLVLSRIHSYTIYQYSDINRIMDKDLRARDYSDLSYFYFIGGKTQEGIICGEKAIQVSIRQNGTNSEETRVIKANLEQWKKGNYEDK
ncbi:hypothetical protein [Parabacteroides sp. FAFU027]|uniref:hypothetical protein n=1 Tax=Parabacteroides sp. FAFU027 TaxID=2922715 RepID=UPI001FAF4AA2|nr:hypothetical protein [Parabacteroides sp. FAFU027]